MKIFWSKNLLALPVLELQNKKSACVCVKKRGIDRQRQRQRNTQTEKQREKKRQTQRINKKENSYLCALGTTLNKPQISIGEEIFLFTAAIAAPFLNLMALLQSLVSRLTSR